jgi:hypothetical protein
VLVHCRKGSTSRVRATVANAILLANIAVLVLLLTGGTASAQNGIFDTILGRRAAPTAPAAPPVSAYADPFSAWNLFGSPGPQPLQPLMDTAVAYCVRLCDGRFFPVQRHEGARHRSRPAARSARPPEPRSTAAPASIRRSQRTAGATPTSARRSPIGKT